MKERIEPGKIYKDSAYGAQAEAMSRDSRREDTIKANFILDAINRGDFSTAERIAGGTNMVQSDTEGLFNTEELLPVDLLIESSLDEAVDSGGEKDGQEPLNPDHLSGSLSSTDSENPSALMDLSTLLEGDELPKPKDQKQKVISRIKGIFGG